MSFCHHKLAWRVAVLGLSYSTCTFVAHCDEIEYPAAPDLHGLSTANAIAPVVQSLHTARLDVCTAVMHTVRLPWCFAG